jgi:hypothetical protein
MEELNDGFALSPEAARAAKRCPAVPYAPHFPGRLLTRQDEATDACATVAEFPIKPCFPELRGVRLNVGFGERIGLGKWLMRSAA